MTLASKTDALDALEATRSEWLAAARAWARQYASDGRAITINDVRQFGPRLPDEVDPRVCGAVFRDRETWRSLGYVPSARRTSHNRPVARFCLR